MNPRTPVVVGVGQVLNRSKDLDDAISVKDDKLYIAEFQYFYKRLIFLLLSQSRRALVLH